MLLRGFSINYTFVKFLLILGFIVSLNSCKLSWNASQILQQQSFYVFGTEVNIELLSDNLEQGQKAIHSIEQRFHKFNTDWHAWEDGGIISKINKAIAENKDIEIPLTVKQFIQKSQGICLDSNGFFEPAIGKLISIWGFHSEEWQGPPPSSKYIQDYLTQKPSILDIRFNGNILYSLKPSVQLDFGGNAKGLALNIAIQTLKKNGIKNAVVNIGGDMKVIGSKKGTPWKIGIQNPKNDSQAKPIKPINPIAVIDLKDGESIMTSGTYRRYFKWENKTFSHLLNPKTGMPIDIEKNHFISVTVINKDAIIADAAATALIVSGPNNWQKIAKKLQVDQVFIIDNLNRQFMTPKIKTRIKFTSK